MKRTKHYLATFFAILVMMTAPRPSSAQPTPAEFAASAASSAIAAERSAQASAKSASSAAAIVNAAASASSVAWSSPSPFLLYLVPIIVFIGSLLAILQIRSALKPTAWSLADALSEEVALPYKIETTDANGVKTTSPKLDKDDKPILLPELRASTSRVIALMGMIALLFMFIGFGVFALFSFGSKGSLPDSVNGVVSFLLAGMTLFAPYAINKFASLFQGLAGGK